MMRNRLGYYIKEGFTGIFKHGFMSFATICVITACLIIMGTFALLAINIQAIISNLESQNQIVAYIDENLPDNEAAGIENEIRRIENISTVRFVTREEAFSNFLAKYENNSLFSDLDASVLKDRYVITLKDIAEMEMTRDQLISIPGIVKVNAHLEISKGFVTLRNIAGLVSIALVLMLLLVSVFIMANTIKLATFSRREEIAIMKIVGATNWFIRFPFILQGMMLGIAGSMFAYLIEWGLYYLVAGRLAVSNTFSFITLVPFDMITLPLLISFGVLGLLVGVFGSTSAIKNYLYI